MIPFFLLIRTPRVRSESLNRIRSGFTNVATCNARMPKGSAWHRFAPQLWVSMPQIWTNHKGLCLLTLCSQCQMAILSPMRIQVRCLASHRGQGMQVELPSEFGSVFSCWLPHSLAAQLLTVKLFFWNGNPEILKMNPTKQMVTTKHFYVACNKSAHGNARLCSRWWLALLLCWLNQTPPVLASRRRRCARASQVSEASPVM